MPTDSLDRRVAEAKYGKVWEHQVSDDYTPKTNAAQAWELAQEMWDEESYEQCQAVLVALEDCLRSGDFAPMCEAFIQWKGER